MAPLAVVWSRPAGEIRILPVAKAVSNIAVLGTPLIVAPRKLEEQPRTAIKGGQGGKSSATCSKNACPVRLTDFKLYFAQTLLKHRATRDVAWARHLYIGALGQTWECSSRGLEAERTDWWGSNHLTSEI